MASRIRVRFAPSPTGPLHMGGVRTALYNYLFARKHGGDFILRIEDTDQKRYVPGAESYIQEALAWCGISPNEGFGIGGDSGPYQQSKRRDLYQRELATLLSNGKAYKAFDTPEEMDAVRKAAEAEGKVWQYDAITRMSMRAMPHLPFASACPKKIMTLNSAMSSVGTSVYPLQFSTIKY